MEDYLHERYSRPSRYRGCSALWINGFDSIKRIRSGNSDCTIMVLSMHEEAVFSQEAFMLGANGFLNKSMDSSQLIDSFLMPVRDQNFSGDDRYAEN